MATIAPWRVRRISYTSGSLSYGMYSRSEGKFVLDVAIPMTFKELTWVADEMRSNNVLPECEVYGAGMLNNLKNTFVAMDDPVPLRTLAKLRSAFPELSHEHAEYSRWLRHWN